MTPTSTQIPKCRLCGKNHFARETCLGQLHGATNTSREGRRVLKAEAARPDATRTAATAKPNPPTPPAKAENQTKADKVTPGKRKTAPKVNKRKGRKK